MNEYVLPVVCHVVSESSGRHTWVDEYPYYTYVCRYYEYPLAWRDLMKQYDGYDKINTRQSMSTS